MEVPQPRFCLMFGTDGENQLAQSPLHTTGPDLPAAFGAPDYMAPARIHPILVWPEASVYICIAQHIFPSSKV